MRKYQIVFVPDWVSAWLTQLSWLARKCPALIRCFQWWPRRFWPGSTFLTPSFQSRNRRTSECTPWFPLCPSSDQKSISWLYFRTQKCATGQHLHTLEHRLVTVRVSCRVFEAPIGLSQVASFQQTWTNLSKWKARVSAPWSPCSGLLLVPWLQVQFRLALLVAQSLL